VHRDMDFGEALERFVRTDPKQVEQGIKRAKQKKAGPPRKAPGKLVSGKTEMEAASAAASPITGCGSVPERVRGDQSEAGRRS